MQHFLLISPAPSLLRAASRSRPRAPADSPAAREPSSDSTNSNTCFNGKIIKPESRKSPVPPVEVFSEISTSGAVRQALPKRSAVLTEELKD
ncbi:hypothetical protein NQZ68_010960 [Dissostichus eleginoides]|nr:hypothetical protein NQZ68_010960 [Dissostichus eleginoides]